SKTMGKGGKLHKGFCSKTYQKCQRINHQIGQVVSKRIVEIALEFNSEAIVFENLKGWFEVTVRIVEPLQLAGYA
ncbi:MAG: hypothetical protein F6K49_49440, partial [Moorea sp. SIO3I6]|nr:hypothetical protein [Moorena sp. SIO3I6]